MAREIIAYYITIIGFLLSIGSFVQLLQKVPNMDFSQIGLNESGILILVLFFGIIILVYGLFLVMVVSKKQVKVNV